MMLRTLVLAAAGLAAAACSSDPADVAGSYSIATTNRDNGCNFQNWVVGETATNIPFTITQDGANVTGTIEGGTGAWVQLVLGSRVFTGTVDGNNIDMTLYGTNNATMGTCSYTVNATTVATLAGDALTGRIEYTTATNGSPECGALEGCRSWQDFNGTRPPTP